MLIKMEWHFKRPCQYNAVLCVRGRWMPWNVCFLMECTFKGTENILPAYAKQKDIYEDLVKDWMLR